MSSPSWLVLAVLLVSWTALPSESYLLRRQSRQPCPEVATKLDFDYRQVTNCSPKIFNLIHSSIMLANVDSLPVCGTKSTDLTMFSRAVPLVNVPSMKKSVS